MNKYNFASTNSITESFVQHGIKFLVKCIHDKELVSAAFSIECGHLVDVNFICDENNYVAVRIGGLITNVPDDKRFRVLKTCNVLNEFPIFKYVLDSDGDVNVSYDIPNNENNGVGEVAYELFLHSMLLLNIAYELFMTALILDDDVDGLKQIMIKRLLETHNKMKTHFESCTDTTEEFFGCEMGKYNEAATDQDDEWDT